MFCKLCGKPLHGNKCIYCKHSESNSNVDLHSIDKKEEILDETTSCHQPIDTLENTEIQDTNKQTVIHKFRYIGLGLAIATCIIIILSFTLYWQIERAIYDICIDYDKEIYNRDLDRFLRILHVCFPCILFIVTSVFNILGIVNKNSLKSRKCAIVGLIICDISFLFGYIYFMFGVLTWYR